MKNLLFTVAILSTLAACSVSQSDDTEAGETEGKPNQGPPEVESPPEWYCKDRLFPNQFVTTTATLDDEPGPTSTKDLERCPYVPSSHPTEGGWTGKPYWRGIADVVLVWLEGIGEGPLDADEQHPVWSWHDPNEDGVVPHLANEEDYRSGLIGNFAIWIDGGGVPSKGNRPPIVTASFADVTGSLPTMIGNPFLAGRYNVYGLPCSTATAGNLWTAYSDEFQNNENVDCMANVMFEGADEAHELYPHSPGDPDDRALDVAVCLDNGGEYDPALAALTSGERDGMVYLNWDELALVQQYVVQELSKHPGWEEITVFMDFLENLGYEWNYWPSDPDYPYSRFSSTGICGHPAELRAVVVNDDLVEFRTQIGCPTGMRAVFPDFPLPLIEDIEAHGWSLEGYCTYSYAVAPPPNVGITVVPQITVGLAGNGFDGARYVEVTDLPRDVLDSWMSSFTTTQAEDGIVITAATFDGRDLLTALDIPDGSTMLAVDHLLLGADGDGEPMTEMLELAVYVDAVTASGRYVTAMFDTPDGVRMTRHIVPSAGLGLLPESTE